MPLIARPAAGQIVDPAWGTLVADAVVMRFTTAAQRTSQLTAPVPYQLTSIDARPGVVQYWTGSAWADLTAPGTELGYAQITANKTVTATTEAAGDLVVAAPSITLDGTTPVLVEFYTSAVIPAAVATAAVNVFLSEAGVSLGRLAIVSNPAAGQLYTPVHASRRLTPSAGAHVFNIGAFVGGGNGIIAAGAGGTGAQMPAFVRVTRV